LVVVAGLGIVDDVDRLRAGHCGERLCRAVAMNIVERAALDAKIERQREELRAVLGHVEDLRAENNRLRTEVAQLRTTLEGAGGG